MAADERLGLAERFELFVNQVDEALFVTNATRDRVLYMSPAFERITGVPVERVYASAAALAELIHPDDRDTFIRSLGSRPEIGPGRKIEREYRLLRRSARDDAEPELRWIWARYSLVSPGDDTDMRVVGILTDITERKLAAIELERVGRTMALFDDAVDEVFLLLSPSRDRVLYASASVERMFGVSREAAYAESRALLSHVHPDDRERLFEVFGQSIPEDPSGLSHEYRVVSRGGELRWVVSRLRALAEHSPLPGAVVAISMDITARHEAEDRLRQLTEELEGRVAERTSNLEHERRRLRASLLEKDALLNEVHHRVKNNLQVVSSLLYLQGTNADDSVRAVLDECRTRIRSMALIHEQLYVSGELSKIEMYDFLTTLGEELGRIYHANDPAPTIVVTGRGLVLDIERAVPVALMANELLTNALKYAYPDPERFVAPQVRVRVGADSLVIEDDGVGLPADLDEMTTGSLGLRLVRSLARQVDATIEFVREGGTRVCVRMPPDP